MKSVALQQKNKTWFIELETHRHRDCFIDVAWIDVRGERDVMDWDRYVELHVANTRDIVTRSWNNRWKVSLSKVSRLNSSLFQERRCMEGGAYELLWTFTMLLIIAFVFAWVRCEENGSGGPHANYISTENLLKHSDLEFGRRCRRRVG